MQTFLILTHLVPFILIPAIMFAIHKKREYLKTKVKSLFAIQLGFGIIIPAMLFEVLWHWLVQGWLYNTSDMHFFNGMMFTLTNLGFAFVAYGFKKYLWTDIILALCVIITPIGYFIFSFKPITYSILSVILLILTIRSYLVLRSWKVFLFPIFAAGVNIIFLSLLFSTNNPVYHILHDMAGTLLGTALFGWAIYSNEGDKKHMGVQKPYSKM